jgi:hypothetical protein
VRSNLAAQSARFNEVGMDRIGSREILMYSGRSAAGILGIGWVMLDGIQV